VRTVCRAEAGRRLATGLGALAREVHLVVAVSPGGVKVASEIARAFEAPLDVMVGVRLDVPGRQHSLFGAVVDGSTMVLPDRVRNLNLPEEYVRLLTDRAQEYVEREGRIMRGGESPIDCEGRTVVLADDGLTHSVVLTGAARALREQGASRLVFVAPMAGPELLAAILPYCDGHLVLFEPAEALEAMICDERMEQTTRVEAGAIVRQSRAHLTAVP
jgi:putative phosphoribosyl transferase